MSNEEEKFRFKIFLVKDEFIDSPYIKDESELESFCVNGNTISYKRLTGKDPKWFTNFFGQESHGCFQTGIRGFFERKIQISDEKMVKFVITFGGAESLLDLNNFDSTFGRRIALNVENGFYQIKRDKISTTQSKTREDVVKIKNIGDFDIQYGLDLITSVIVKPKDDFFIQNKITGSNFVSFSFACTLDNIDELLINCYKESCKSEYLQKYDWIERIQEVVNNDLLIDKIKEEAFKTYMNRDFSKFWIAIKDVFDWENVSGFTIRHSRNRKLAYSSQDIDIDQFTQFITNNNISIESLNDFKNFKVDITFSADSETISQDYWSLFDCIYCEVQIENSNYVINGGKFYKIDTSYCNKINQEFEALVPIQPYPENSKTQREDEYINELCNEINYKDDLVNLDKVFVKFDDNIEICDIYDKKNKAFVHIKKDGASAHLSHLYAQAKVSARILCDNSNIAEINKVYKEKRNFELEPFNKNDVKIIMAIISNKKIDSTGKINLPFFSKINSILSKNEIERMGFTNVKFMFIHSSVPLNDKSRDQRVVANNL